MTFDIHRAMPADAALIAQQRHAMYLDMGEDPEKLLPLQASSLAWHRQALESGLYTGLLVEVDDKVVGGAGILWQAMPPNPDSLLSVRAYIMNVYVGPENRGQGLARQLLERALAECAARGITIISLHASEAGRPLYEKLGFKATNELKKVVSNLSHAPI